MKAAWVLWHRYDGSECKILRAYTDAKRAAEDFSLVEETISDVKFELTEVQFHGPGP